MTISSNKHLVEFVSFITPDGVEYPIFGGRRSLLSWEGMGMPPVRYLEERGVFQQGVTVRDYRVDSRIITIQQFERGLCREDFYCSVGNLIEAIRPNRDSDKGAGELLVVLKNGVQRTIKARYYDGIRADWGNEPLLDSDMLESITFYCEEPFWDDVEREIVSAGILDVGSCLSICLPACFGSDIINAEVELVYTGTWDGDRLTIYINGPAVQPTITNLTTGKQIKLNYNISDGETLLIEIDPQSKRIVSSTSGVLPPGIVADVSDLVSFYLATRGNLTADGTNIMQITASGGVAGQTSVEVEYTVRHWSLFAPCFVPPFPQPIFYAPYLTDTDSDTLPLPPITDTGALLATNDATGRTALYADAALTNQTRNPRCLGTYTSGLAPTHNAIAGYTGGSEETTITLDGQAQRMTTAGTALQGVRLDDIAISGYTSASISAYVYIVSYSPSARLRFFVNDVGGGGVVVDAITPITNDMVGKWTRVGGGDTFAAATGILRQQIMSFGGNCTFIVARVSTFVGIDYLPPWFSGATTGAAWDGTADNSTSTKAALNLRYILANPVQTKWTLALWLQLSDKPLLVFKRIFQSGSFFLNVADGFYVLPKNLQAAPEPSAGSEQFVVVAYDNGIINFYTDGVLQSSSAEGNMTIYDFAVGSNLGGGNETAGFIRDVAIWNKTLSAEQIRRLSEDSTPFIPQN